MKNRGESKRTAYRHADFGQRLRALRMARGIGIDELGERLNAKLGSHGHPPRRVSTVRGWEIGRHLPDAHVVKSLEEILEAELLSAGSSSDSGLIIDLPNVDFDWDWSIAESERYLGKYIEYRYSFKDNSLTTIWLEIFRDKGKTKGVEYCAKQKTGAGIEVRGRGVVMANDRNIYLFGCKNDTLDIEAAILLSIPMNQKFRFLHGIVLTTSYQRAIFAGKFVCEKIEDVDRWESYGELIGNFDIAELEKKKNHDEKSRFILDKFIEHQHYITNRTEEQKVLKILL